VDIPLPLFCEYLTPFCVCHFKDKKHGPESPPHYYVIVPVSDTSSLLLCIITSQIEKRVNHYSRVNQKAIDSLVRVNQDTLTFLTKESLIDCNGSELIPKADLIKRIDSSIKPNIVTRQIPKDLKKKIVLAIKKSPVVKPHIKQLILWQEV